MPVPPASGPLMTSTCFERACQILVNAYATGKPLRVLSDAVAERTARDWESIADFSIAHFEEMKKVLDGEDPSYRD